MMDAVDVVGYVYCPPGWDEQRLRSGPDAEAIGQIAVSTYTDIAYIKEKNAIQISGETHDDVYQAQNKLNALFFPVIVKSKRQWARPDRPGVWGQRRDSTNGGNANGGAGANNNNNPSNGNNTANGGNGGNGGEPQQNGGRGIRKMRSESSLRPQSQQPQPYGAPASQTHGWK
ncbi:uncharacterized protein BJ171DRAFT_157850 [Polychytrium aggregatum]|uniref:uncharacterized protein n=1 Tax=Polychytrium aggregatum TaxID=110093 RepID=UPI0022FEDBD8|nr:uncharacterized protein BJ171DRAFT_157850 [Polychytrium aggregatum]KAI9203002.1 hypothetical protein BJ171DRAFT_157850 [Polychytrium aggregatum]